jgi:hypothetical protein
MGLIYRLDASDTSTLFSDDGKTTNATDNDAVAVWSPAGGSITTDATQTTSGSRPTYRANYASSGKPAVEFASDFMTIAHSSGWNITTAFDIVWVCNAASVSTGAFRLLLHKFVSGAWNDGLGVGQSLGTFQAGSPSYNNCTLAEVAGEIALMHFRTGSSARAWRIPNNPYWKPITSVAANTTPVTNSANLTLGQQGGGSFAWLGGLHELAIFSGGETEATITAELDAMIAKWGINTGFAASGGGAAGLTGIRGVGMRLGK